jgi:hypothetical protein
MQGRCWEGIGGQLGREAEEGNRLEPAWIVALRGLGVLGYHVGEWLRMYAKHSIYR